MQEFSAPINNKLAPGRKFNWIKWGIWIVWFSIIALLAVKAGGYHTIDPLYNLEGGVTFLQPMWYMIYYIVIGVFLTLSIVVGRRAGCHYICWMAPFMIIGTKVRNVFKLPALRLQAEPEKCIDCKRCTQNCPMSLDVHQMVRARSMENDECILCATCADNCPKDVLHLPFKKG